MNKLCILLILLSIVLSSCGAGKPKGGEGVSYFGAAWLSNERIVYTKQVDTVRFSYNPLAALGNNTSQLLRTDYFICTMDLNGEDEKVLKQFSVTDPKSGRGVRRIFMMEDGKEVPLSTTRPQRPSIYSCSKDLIAFVARISEGGAGSPGPIYVMKPDGSQLRQVVEKGDYPRLSPDGKMILYTRWQDRIPQLWLINIDKTWKMKVVDKGEYGIWSPDGKRIAYWKEEENRRHFTYIVGLDGKNPERVKQDAGIRPYGWSLDGSMIMFEGSFFSILTNQWVDVTKGKGGWFPDVPSLSPDGKKIVGDPAGIEGEISVLFMDGPDFKVLKKNHSNLRY